MSIIATGSIALKPQRIDTGSLVRKEQRIDTGSLILKARRIDTSNWVTAITSEGGVSEPTVQPSSFVFSNVAKTSMDISWTAGNGTHTIILRSTSAITDVPVDLSNYSVGDTIGSCTVEYFDTGTSFTDSGLTAYTQYFYAGFAVNGATGTWVYLTTSPLEDSRATLFDFGNAFSLDGINDAFSRASVSTFSNMTAFDIGVWFYVDPSAAVNQILVMWLPSSGTQQHGFAFSMVYVSAGVFKLTGVIYSGSTTTLGQTGNISLTGGWHFGVMKFKGSGVGNDGRLKIKYDDVAQSLAFTGTIPAALGSNTMPLVIGRTSLSTVFFKGKIDHVAIKHGTWSDAEDTAHYNSGNGAEYASYNEFWSANSTPNDAGVNALNLTAENGATYAAH